MLPSYKDNSWPLPRKEAFDSFRFVSNPHTKRMLKHFSLYYYTVLYSNM